MVDANSEVIVRFMERKAHRTVKEIQGWSNLEFTKRARKVGSGSITVPRDEITSAIVSLILNDNLAIYIRHTIDVPSITNVASKATQIVTQFHGPVYGFPYASGPEVFTFNIQDNLAYLNDRTVYTSGAATVDPGTVTCIAYVRSLLDSELFSPTDGTRAIDIPAELDGATIGGSAVDLPVRWGSLGAHIERALIDGDCYIEAPLVDSGDSRTVKFRVKQVEDQTAGSGGTVAPVSVHLTGSDIRVEVNHAPVRNRYYVLGENTGSSRAVTTRTASTIKGRMREMVVDARHLTTTAEREALGDALLAESAEAETRAEILNVDRTVDIRPGMKVTLAERMASDATQPDLGPVDVIVLAKKYALTPDSEQITLQVGHEPRDMAFLFNSYRKQAEAAAFE